MNRTSSMYLQTQNNDQLEFEIIIDLGMLYTKVGTSNEQIPFKMVMTPPEIFLNPNLFKEENLKIFNNYSNELYLRINEFLYNIFFKELLCSPKNNEIVIGINLFVPNHYLLCIERVLIEKFKAKTVFFVPTQFAPIYMSNNESGIVIDFGFTNTTIVPFHKGFPLKNFIRTTKKSGCSFFKRLHKSIVKINPKFEELGLNDKMHLLNMLMVEYVTFNSLKEVAAIGEAENKQDTDKMRHKLLKMINEKMNVYINFLENYRVCQFMFDNSNSVTIDILDALLEIPTQLRDFLVNNIIVVGGFCLTNKFITRLKDELNFYLDCNPFYKDRFTDFFKVNFCFTTHDYPINLLNWSGRWLNSFHLL